jgi:hypothetical protein
METNRGRISGTGVVVPGSHGVRRFFALMFIRAREFLGIY